MQNQVTGRRKSGQAKGRDPLLNEVVNVLVGDGAVGIGGSTSMRSTGGVDDGERGKQGRSGRLDQTRGGEIYEAVTSRLDVKV